MGGQSVRARPGGVPCSGQGAVRRAHEADEDRAPARREGVFLRSRGFEGVEEGAEGESEEGEVVDCVLICGGFVVVLSILRILGSLTKESGLLLKTKEVTKVWGIFVSLKQATLFPCYVKVCL